MSGARVALVRARPETAVEDCVRACRLGGLEDALAKDAPTVLKPNISWHLFFPGANTTPWQLDGAIEALRKCGAPEIVSLGNETVVCDGKKGERLNRLDGVFERARVERRYNFGPSGTPWVEYRPRAEMLVLDSIFPEGIRVPEMLLGRNVFHLPTLKCHIYTTVTCSMKNAFGGLIHRKRHWTHAVIHETLVDLLAIQKEIHPCIFTLADGTTAGDGPGPRTMRPVEKNVLLAGADPVAIDAVAAKLMGFEPMELPFIRIAHERGLGQGDLREIELVGDEVPLDGWDFYVGTNLPARVGRKVWFGPLRFLERLLFRSPLVHLFILASGIYHDRLWYPTIGRARIRRWMRGGWGKKFKDYA